MAPNATPPSVIVNGSGELWLGDRRVQCTEFDGHSGGTDLIAYIPDADVMIAGDLLFTQRIPYLADGNIRVMQTTLAQLAVDYPTAKIVPGHGPVSDRNDLNTLKSYLEALETLAMSWKTTELTQAAALAQTKLPDTYQDYLFQGLFPSNLETAYQQITLGNDDTAAIKAYFKAQDPALKAL
jgi:cyclase